MSVPSFYTLDMYFACDMIARSYEQNLEYLRSKGIRSVSSHYDLYWNALNVLAQIREEYPDIENLVKAVPESQEAKR